MLRDGAGIATAAGVARRLRRRVRARTRSGPAAFRASGLPSRAVTSTAVASRRIARCGAGARTSTARSESVPRIRRRCWYRRRPARITGQRSRRAPRTRADFHDDGTLWCWGFAHPDRSEMAHTRAGSSRCRSAASAGTRSRRVTMRRARSARPIAACGAGCERGGAARRRHDRRAREPDAHGLGSAMERGVERLRAHLRSHRGSRPVLLGQAAVLRDTRC